MGLLLGIEHLDKVLNDFLLPFEAYAELGPDFSYFYGDSSIWYSLAVADRPGRLYMDFVKSLAPDIKCDIFLISFLHELGHHETLDLISHEDEIYSQDMKDFINETIEKNRNDDDVYAAMNSLYFNLPDEIIATQWAIKYIRAHEQELSVFWSKVQKTLMYIYEINNVEVA